MRIPKRLSRFFLFLGAAAVASAQAAPPKLAIPYGQNAGAGAILEVNGIKLYYENYGAGAPLLLIHGNGGEISHLGHQIEFFSPRYRIVAADSRGHGQSEIGAGRLTYVQQAEDLNALLDHLHLKSVFVLGWSDGGILGLLLAIHHPDKVAKLAIMGANLQPDGAYPWAEAWVAKNVKLADEMIAKGDQAQPWAVVRQHLDLLGKQPDIALSAVGQIAVPVLVMAGDKDVIRLEHTRQIFDHLRQAHLAIFPGSTHLIPWEDPALFNQTVERFFREPYTRPDTKDLFK